MSRPAGPNDFVLRGRRVVAAELPGGIGPASIRIRNEKIIALAGFDDVPAGWAVVEAGERVVMPGLVDTHVHINEPGRADWEGFATATRAAAAGGITTLVDMPLNCIPPATTRAHLDAKREAARGQLGCDVAFWGGIVPGNASHLPELAAAGVCGFKCFLVSSGVDEFPAVGERDLHAALAALARIAPRDPLPVLVHAEWPEPIAEAAGRSSRFSPTAYAGWLAARPAAAENQAIEILVRLAREFRARLHIVHLSSAEALPLLARARSEGLAITVETCPHYLTFAAEEIPDGATEYKCAPPIRPRANREQLWRALGEGAIDLVASDHSPCPPAMKRRAEGDFQKAWGGIASLEWSLAAVWTEARHRGYTPPNLARWLAAAPAALAGLGGRKGAIAAGSDADLVVWNAEAEFTASAEDLHHRHKISPYAGRRLAGVVEATYLRGVKIYDRTAGGFPVPPAGKILRRGSNEETETEPERRDSR